MSISANYPNLRPSLLLDFANSQALDFRITFSRSTSAPYYDADTNVLAEQNLLQYSQDYTQSVWTKSAITNTGASTTAPDGTTTGSLIDDGTSTGFHVLQYSVATNGTVTVSGYVKNINRQYVGLIVFGAGGSSTYISAVFDLANTTNTTSQNGSGYSVTSATITSVGNSWYRITLSGTVSSATLMAIYPSNSATAGYVPSYTGTNQQFYLWGAQLEQRSSATAYNATTTSALTNYIPQLLTAPINSPRFDFNPTTGESLGLLIEQSSTNLLTYSQDFSNAAWTKTRSSVTTSANIAPDGTQTAQVLYEDTSNNSHLTYEAYTITAGNPYIFSMYAKAWTRTQLGITFDNVSWSFDLSAGTILSGSAGTITPVGNGWYRITCYRASITTASSFVFIIINNAGAGSYQGNGYSGIYIWGAQLEALAFPTSYIPTTSAQVTRASDKAVILNVSGIYNPTQGTILVQGSQNSTFGQNYPLASFSDGTLTNKLYTELYGAITYGIAGNSATLTGQSVGAIKTPFKMALAAQTNDAQLCTNGTLNQSSSSLTMPPNISELDIGCFINFGSQIRTYNGCISKIAYYPIRVTNAQLQALTGS